MPSSARSAYSAQLKSFYSANQSTIKQQAAKGTYRDASGEKVSGKQAGITGTEEEGGGHVGGGFGGGEEGGSHVSVHVGGGGK